jgi:hypothetical protein
MAMKKKKPARAGFFDRKTGITSSSSRRPERLQGQQQGRRQQRPEQGLEPELQQLFDRRRQESAGQQQERGVSF